MPTVVLAEDLTGVSHDEDEGRRAVQRVLVATDHNARFGELPEVEVRVITAG